jgi:hypothetical protein
LWLIKDTTLEQSSFVFVFFGEEENKNTPDLGETSFVVPDGEQTKNFAERSESKHKIRTKLLSLKPFQLELLNKMNYPFLYIYTNSLPNCLKTIEILLPIPLSNKPKFL